MSRLCFLAAGTGLLMLPGIAAALPPAAPAPWQPATGAAILRVQAPAAPSANLSWAQARLAEINVVLGALDAATQKLAADTRKRAEDALKQLRDTRDAFAAKVAAAVAEGGKQTSAQAAETMAVLDAKWNEFERNLEAYFASIDAPAALRSAVVAAREKAEELHWQQAIAALKDAEAKAAAESRPQIDAAIAALQSYADSAKAQLSAMQQAGGNAWAAMWQGLADAKQAFEKAYEGVQAQIDGTPPAAAPAPAPAPAKPAQPPR